MNNQYRKKPVIIEAFQMTKERRWDNSEWPNWLNKAWSLDKTKVGCLFCQEADLTDLYLRTLEGVHLVSWGDFIIQGILGELYPCKPDIFEATYEKVWVTILQEKNQ